MGRNQRLFRQGLPVKMLMTLVPETGRPCRAAALRPVRPSGTDQIMRRLKILHRIYYNFCGLVQLQPHRLLLRPREGAGLHIECSKLDIEPAAQLRWMRDAYDNSVAMATFCLADFTSRHRQRMRGAAV